MVSGVDTLKTDLKHYMKQFKGRIDKNLCDTLVREIDTVQFEQHTFYDAHTDKDAPRSGSKELSVSWDDCPSRSILTGKLWYVIRDYLTDVDMPWFVKWSGYTEPRFNRYDEDKKMALHCDHIQSMFDGKRKGIPILSVLGVLNDDYEGGEFIMFDDTEIKFDKGDILVFPSIFLYPHKVEPVKSGTRYSYISWVW
tara:strand:- start:494 stop:1081 length:588 start_codon:yes stop_codon:yes gene_type:complete